jgi:hypothetical protein
MCVVPKPILIDMLPVQQQLQTEKLMTIDHLHITFDRLGVLVSTTNVKC